MNSLIARHVGYGETLSKFSLTKEDIIAKCNKIIGDERYFNVIKKTRAMFVDRLLHPLEEGLFWTNRVIKNRGKNAHFKRKGMDLHWHKYLYVDSLAFMFLLFGLVALK